MQSIETEGPVQEIEWALTGTANAAELDQVLWHEVQFITGSNDLAGDRIMSTPLAQRAGIAPVIVFTQPDQVDLAPGCLR